MQIETPFKDERKAAYLNFEGADRPLKSPVPDTVLAGARAYRLGRLREQMARADVAGLLLYDPANIRYAFDSSNMQVWTAHNPTRYALILSDGPAIIFEYIGCEHLAEGLPGVDEVRPAVTYMFLNKGDKSEGFVADWADEICDLVRQHGTGNRRLAVDKLDPDPANALVSRGLTLINGTALTEMARSIKSQDEVELMRWTMRVCEAGMARIYDHSLPGVTEQELWAHLHFENARSGGDWLETKLVTAGPNTNPWFKECSDRPVQAGEMISFDTDMIGPYGYCADLSRSWVCGYQPMTDTQRRLYAASLEQIEHNRELIRPSVDFIEFDAKSWRIPERYLEFRYPACLHGVGMADEWPVLPLYPDWDSRVMSGQFEPGMVICLESLVAEKGSESIKFETQVLVTDTGCEPLDTFPWEQV